MRLQRGRDVEVLETLSVGEVMQTEFTTLRESEPIKVVADTLMRTRHHGLPVVNDAGELAGIITVQDVDRVQTDNPPALTIGQACTREVLITYPDETIGAALRRMSTRDVGRLPVVTRDNPRRLIGVLRRTDLVRAYDIALTRRAAIRHQAHQVRLGSYSGVSVEEIMIEAGAPCANKRVSEVAWPRDCVIATLRPQDVLVVVAEGEARDTVRRWCRADGFDITSS